jgi:hypothetical protein
MPGRKNEKGAIPQCFEEAPPFARQDQVLQKIPLMPGSAKGEFSKILPSGCRLIRLHLRERGFAAKWEMEPHQPADRQVNPEPQTNRPLRIVFVVAG